MLMKEHPIYTNYLITSNGDVISKNYRNTGKKRLMKLINNVYGYLQVKLCKDGKYKNYRINRLVAETFLPNPDNKPEVNHKDGNKHNNCVDNLEWCTSSENELHAYRIGLKKANKNMLGRFGKLNPTSKKVKQVDKVSGKIIKTWDSMSDIERELGINQGNISRVCQGKLKSLGGFKWEYLEEYR